MGIFNGLYGQPWPDDEPLGEPPPWPIPECPHDNVGTEPDAFSGPVSVLRVCYDCGETLGRVDDHDDRD